MKKSYTIIVYVDGQELTRRNGVDEINSIVIPAEMKMRWPQEFELGRIRVEVVEE